MNRPTPEQLKNALDWAEGFHKYGGPMCDAEVLAAECRALQEELEESHKTGSRAICIGPKTKENPDGPCPIGAIDDLRIMYRCFDCERWVCVRCAKEHFGGTRQERDEKIAQALMRAGKSSDIRAERAEAEVKRLKTEVGYYDTKGVIDNLDTMNAAKDQEIDKLKEIVIRHQHNNLENERRLAAKDQEVEQLMERDGQWKVKWEKQVDAHAQSILNDEKQIASLKMELAYSIVAKLVAKNTRIKELEAELKQLEKFYEMEKMDCGVALSKLSHAMAVVEAAKELRLRPSCVMETQAIGLCEHTECKLYDALAAYVAKEVKK